MIRAFRRFWQWLKRKFGFVKQEVKQSVNSYFTPARSAVTYVAGTNTTAVKPVKSRPARNYTPTTSGVSPSPTSDLGFTDGMITGMILDNITRPTEVRAAPVTSGRIDTPSFSTGGEVNNAGFRTGGSDLDSWTPTSKPEPVAETKISYNDGGGYKSPSSSDTSSWTSSDSSSSSSYSSSDTSSSSSSFD